MGVLSAAASGLLAANQDLGTVAQNLANLDTVGYKSEQDLFTQMYMEALSGGSAPTAVVGGTDPLQVPTGSAVGLAQIATNFTEGSLQQTGIASNAALAGAGWFVVQSSQGQGYTRAGDFTTDANGNLVTPAGARVLGWSAAAVAAGTQSATNLVPLSIPENTTLAPTATTGATLSGNLDASSATTAGSTTQIALPVTLYDGQGNTIAAQLVFSNPTVLATGGVQWTAALMPAGSTTPYDGSGTTTPLTVTLTFAPGAAPTWSTPPTWTVPTTDGSPSVSFGLTNGDVSALTSYAAATSAIADANGSGVGTLSQYAVGTNGVITGTFSNGQTSTLGQIAVATFPNEGGLMSAGPSLWTPSPNAGPASIGIAGTGGRGSLVAGSVEQSNVTLANQFTHMVAAQENYGANAKMLTVDQANNQALINAVQ